MPYDVPTDWLTVERRYSHCDRCGYNYPAGNFYVDCPKCVAQATPLGIAVTKVDSHMGPDWIWAYNRGPSGCWVPASEFAVIERGSYHIAMQELGAYLTDDDVGFTLPELIRRVLRRLGDGRPTQAEIPKMSALADQAADLDRQLRAKRADCDALRDRVEELEAAVESIANGGRLGPAETQVLRRMIRR